MNFRFCLVLAIFIGLLHTSPHFNTYSKGINVYVKYSRFIKKIKHGKKQHAPIDYSHETNFSIF